MKNLLRKQRVLNNCMNASQSHSSGIFASSQLISAQEKFQGVSQDMFGVSSCTSQKYLNVDFDLTQQTVNWYCFPNGLPDRVDLCSKLFLAQYYYDDMQDAPEKLRGHPDRYSPIKLQQMAAILKNENPRTDSNPNPMLNGLYEVCEELRGKADSKWYKKMVKNIFDSLAAQKEVLADGTNVVNYIHSRMFDGGMLTVYDFIEYVHDDYLNPAMEKHVPALNALRKFGAIHYALSNDLHGYMHEIEHPKNLLNVHWRQKYGEQDEDFTRAILECVGIVNEMYGIALGCLDQVVRETDMAVDKKQLSVGEADSVISYAEKIKEISVSEHFWSAGDHGERYKSPFHFFQDMRPNE